MTVAVALAVADGRGARACVQAAVPDRADRVCWRRGVALRTVRGSPAPSVTVNPRPSPAVARSAAGDSRRPCFHRPAVCLTYRRASLGGRSARACNSGAVGLPAVRLPPFRSPPFRRLRLFRAWRSGRDI